jgi:photosystem II stability/assembly factor-like uncharacterized protein
MRKHIPISSTPKLLLAVILTLGSMMILGRCRIMPVHAANPAPAPISDFQLVTPSQGWILINGQLLFTINNGQSWQDITPASDSFIREAFFLDQDSGIAVSQSVDNQAQTLRIDLHRTMNGGTNWESSQIAQFTFEEPEAAIAQIHAGFAHRQFGWVILRQLTSSNFNVGTLYLTEDGGGTWQKRSAPLGEPAVFINPFLGFMAGGVGSAQLFKTTDGGITWTPEPQIPTSDYVGLPYFTDPKTALLPIVTSSSLQIYQSTDGGNRWAIENQEAFGSVDGPVLFDSALDAIRISAGASLITFSTNTAALSTYRVSQPPNLILLDFYDSTHGWGLINSADCTDEDDEAPCQSDLRLLSTLDGGNTWEPVETPVILPDPGSPVLMPKFSREAVQMLSRTAVLIGQGFDKCEVATASQLQVWKNQSPFSAVNLYIGGQSRYCDNESLNQALVESLAAQGWKFIPTWVGPQAACTEYSYTMNDDPDIAYQQGRDNAWDAARIAMKLGLSEPDQSGTVIYYDLEAFDTTSPECLDAAKAFINGWVEQLHEYGVLAGLYGSVCASGLEDFYDIDNPPDVIWPARYIGSHYQYLSDQSVYNLPCLSNAKWGNTQRILQYTNTIVESWGGTSLDVDLNVVNGIVADITSVVGSPDTALQNPSFENPSIAPWETVTPTACTTSIISNEPLAFSGDKFLAIHKDPGDPDCLGIQQPVTTSLSPGEQYRFAIWARSSDPAALRAFDLVLTPQGGAAESTVQPFSGITDQWLCLEIAHTIQNSGHTSLIPSINLDDADGIDLYLDNAQLTRNTGKLCPNLLSPTSLTASDGHHPNIITLSWDSVPMATFYRVYRSETPGGAKTLLGRSTTTSFEDTSVDFEQEFYYVVKACNAGVCSNFSNQDLGYSSAPFLDFYDDFETGTLDKWVQQPASDELWVCLSGARSGSYGLCFDTTSNTDSVVAHDLFAPSSSLDVQFSIDPNNISIGSTNLAIATILDDNSNKAPAILQIRNSGAGYAIRVRVLDDANLYHDSTWVSLPNNWSTVRFEWTATIGQAKSTSSFSGVRLWINNDLKLEMFDIINYSLKADAIQFGGEFSGSLDGPGGTIYLDDFSYSGSRHVRPVSP